MLALTQNDDGGSGSDEARIGRVTLQFVRVCVMRFNAGRSDVLLDSKALGKCSILDDAQRLALIEALERGTIPAINGVVRWRLTDLVR